jgi:hypothetical protein
MVYFLTKNPNLGKFLRDFERQNFGTFYGHSVFFMIIFVYIMIIFVYIMIIFVYFMIIFVYFMIIWKWTIIWYIVSRKIWQPCRGHLESRFFVRKLPTTPISASD